MRETAAGDADLASDALQTDDDALLPRAQPEPTHLPPVRHHHPPPAGHVNEVQFAFLDGAPETPQLSRNSPRANALRSQYGYSPVTRDFDAVQHLAGAGSPNSIFDFGRILFFLVLLGIIPSTIIFLVDLSVHNLFSAREGVSVQGFGGIPGFFVYLISGVVLCLAATAACHVWSVEAEGSGIPQMKSLMSGFYDKGKPALSMWALLAKGVGLVCAIGGGLPVGWEGPNVHISCIVAHHLSRLPCFRSMRRDRALRMQIMACACAVGLASSFGTPIGGVLYALETTSSFYLVPTFWKCMLSTLAGALVYDMLYKTPLVEAFENTNFEAGDYTRTQLLAFIVMGAILGALGAFFVRCVHYVYIVRKRKLPGTNRYVLLGVVGAVAALVQYPLRLFRLDPRSAINEFFSATNMETLSTIDVALLVLVKFPLIAISIGLPIPAGVFIPCFLLGSGMGRLYGEFMRLLFGSAIVPGGYAVVGAAAFTAGVTRALSVAVVLFEVTGQLKHMVPTLAAVLIAVIVANGINRSLYDTLIIMKELPYMPHMRRDRRPSQRVYQVMRTNVVSLEENTTLGIIRSTLDAYPSFNSFPLVTDSELLLGSVRRRSLLNLLNNPRHDDAFSNQVNGTRSEELRRGPPSTSLDGMRADSAQGSVESPTPGEERKASDTTGGSFPGEDGVQHGGGSNERPFETFQTDLKPFTEDVGDEESDDDTNMAADAGIASLISPTAVGVRATGSGIELKTIRDSNGVLPVAGALDDEDFGRDTVTRLVPDLSPLVVTENTTLSQLHFMFVMLMPTHAYVLSGGVLQGVLTRGDIIVR